MALIEWAKRYVTVWPPKGGVRTNRERAEMVRPLIECFAEACYVLEPDREDTTMVVGDFLCDLRHYVEIIRGGSWSAVEEHARRHYNHESGFEPDEETD